jgi:hypothetical protein
MILKAIVDDQVYELQVPETLIDQAARFFDELDRDMDRGWQMSRDWVPAPDRLQRCQIVANKLLTALENANERLGRLMAGYILARLPDVDSVELDTQGEIQNTRFTLTERPPETLAPIQPPARAGGLGKLQAMEQAGNDVTPVFKVGKGYRFAVLDRASNQWQDSPLFATEPEAARLRQEAFKARFEELQRSSG